MSERDTVAERGRLGTGGEKYSDSVEGVKRSFEQLWHVACCGMHVACGMSGVFVFSFLSVFVSMNKECDQNL